MLLISLPILVPIVGAVLAWLSGRIRPELPRWVALLTGITELTAVALLLREWDSAGALMIEEQMRLQNGFPLWNLALDGISVPLVVLTAVLGTVSVLASWRVERAPGAHHAMLLLLSGATMGVFLAADMILLYVFWEAVLIPMYFLIGRWGHQRRRHAATKFFIYTFAGSALMLVGMLIVLTLTRTSSILGATQSLVLQPPDKTVGMLLFWLFAAGFLVKVPAVPFHTWLPDAHVEAPTAGSMMLAGVLLKMGGYGLIRMALPLFPDAAGKAAPILAALGIVGILYGALTAMAQTDLKRLVAYSSVAHMGFVLLAVAVGTEGAIGAAMLVMVSHGVVSALMFLLVGTLYERTHTRTIARFGGLMRTIPAWGMAFSFAALASLGLPGLSGFPGELLTMLEAFGAFGWWLVPALVGLVVSAAYHLWAIRRVNHGDERAEWTGLEDLRFTERVAVSTLAFAIVLLGVWPSLVLTVTGPAASYVAILLTGGS